jgi:hypothetical protein
MQKNPRSVFCQVIRNSTNVTMALHSTVNFSILAQLQPKVPENSVKIDVRA